MRTRKRHSTVPTPWDYAQQFSQSKWTQLRKATEGTLPTRPKEVVNTLIHAWNTVALPVWATRKIPGWVFLFLPNSTGLWEYSSNIDEPTGVRHLYNALRLDKLVQEGGMAFYGVYPSRGDLVVGGVAVVKEDGVYIFDANEDNKTYSLLTEEEWNALSQI